MIARIERKELEVCYINGIAVVPAIARGGRVVLAVGGYDADGLLVEDDEVVKKARLWQSARPKLDNRDPIRKDDG